MTASGAADPERAGDPRTGTLPAGAVPGGAARQGRAARQGGAPCQGGAARADPGAPPAARFDLVALGESMVTFLPSRPGRLADVPSFERAIGGAESNVACGLAGAGHTATWVSRVGADGFGDHLVERIAAYGVDTSDVQRDPERPTGIYFRTAGERAVSRTEPDAPAASRPVPDASAAPGTAPDALAAPGATQPPAGGPPAAPLAEVVYYRAGSAASAMSPENMPGDVLRSGRILHLTGITAALSPGCRALLDDLTTHPAPPTTGDSVPGTRATGHDVPPAHRPLLSFDVNYRVSLWRPADRPGSTLLDLARRCDLVFVGEDEAEAAWGVTGGPAAVRALLPEPPLLVVKQGATGVTVFHREQPDGDLGRGTRPAGAGAPDTVTSVPALHVDVVAPVGAGDAFAAGFLSGTLRGLPVRDRVRHGHLMAAAALTVPGDLGDLGDVGDLGGLGDVGDLGTPAEGPSTPWLARADRLAALDEEAWGTLRLGPGWTDTTGAVPADATCAARAGSSGRGNGADEEVRTP